MNDHSLIKMADMLHRICPTIIKRESRLIKSPRKACTLYPPYERRFNNLVQRFVHGFVSKALMRWTLILTPMTTIFLVSRESFAGWSSRSLPVCGVFCILRRRLGPKRWAPSPCDATSSSVRQSHGACLSYSLHGRHDFSNATDSY